MRMHALVLFAICPVTLLHTDARAQVIPDVGKKSQVCLQSWMGTFVCAEGGGGGAVVANRAEAKGWETFEMHRIDKDHVTLRCGTGQYLCAEHGGNSIMIADRDKVAGWEKFRFSMDGNGRVVFQVSNGMYMCAEDNGLVVANRTQLGAWEAFRVVSPELANSSTYRIEINVYKIASEPLWHTGTVIDGREYYFQTSNQVESTHPKGMALKHHRTIVRFVPGNKDRALAVLRKTKDKWDGRRYDVAARNCNYFTNDLLAALGTSGLDGEYLRASGLAQVTKNIPGGATLGELLVKWPPNDKRLDESFMEDIRRIGHLPRDTINEIKRAADGLTRQYHKHILGR